MDLAAFIYDEKSLALKRALTADGHESAHSCAHCSAFFIRLPHPGIEHKRQSFFSLVTSKSKIRKLAQTHCSWWLLFDNQIRNLEFETKLYQRKDKVDFPDYDKWWTDEHYEILSTTLNPSERDEFLNLRRNKSIRWSFSAGSNEVHNNDESVIVSLDYSSLNNFTTKPVIVEARFSLPESNAIRQHGNYFAKFLVLTKPESENLHGCSIFGMPVNTRPDCQDSFRLVRCWLDICATKHDCGILNLPTSMPSILLAVKKKSMRLVLSSEVGRARYAALSYCWGKSAQNTILTIANQDELFRQVSFERLDLSVQDAIKATRETDLEYLWIDALCIVQDDAEFKAAAMAQMHDIYRNATFTLVASRASSVQEGFLSPRQIAGAGKQNAVFEVKYIEDTHSSSDRTVVLIPDQLDEAEPSFERAWMLQESLLSRRRLQFSTKQTTWNCQHGQNHYLDSDGWLPCQFHSYTVHGNKELFDEATSIIWPSAATSGYDREKILRTWDDVVQAYTRRKLSNHADRLPAIASVAIEFAKKLNDEYICGLWKSRLYKDLLWRRMRSRDIPPNQLRSNPSWSWAKCNDEVSLPFPGTLMDDDFEILQHAVRPKFSTNPYGEVDKASLQVRGLITTISELLNAEREQSARRGADATKDEFSNIRSPLIRSLDIVSDAENTDFGIDRWTEDISNPDIANYYLLVVGYMPGSGKHPGEPTGLVLTSIGNAEYIREGVFKIGNIWGDRFFDYWGYDAPNPSDEEYRCRLRYLWGGMNNIKDITMV